MACIGGHTLECSTRSKVCTYYVNLHFSRLIYYPFWILDTTWNRPLVHYEPFPGYYIFNGLLMVLQVLHIIWFSLIAKMAIGLLSGKEVEDSRSSEEELDSDSEKKES